MSRWVVIFLFLAFNFPASSVGRQSHIKSFEIKYDYVDDIKNDKIHVHYINNGKKTVCIGADNWPKNGIMLNNGSSVAIYIGDKKFFLEKEQDFCPFCQIKVKKRQILDDYFKYDSFDIPQYLRHSEKKLIFNPVAYEC